MAAKMTGKTSNALSQCPQLGLESLGIATWMNWIPFETTKK